MEWNKTLIRTTAEGVEAVCGALMEAGIAGVEIDDPAEREEYFETPSQDWDYFDETLAKTEDRDVKVIFYTSANPYGEELMASVRDNISRLKARDFGLEMGSLKIERENNLDDKVWLNKWREFYKPFNVGERLYVKPVWEETAAPEERITLTINPGNVFGTGLHQTTRLCMERLEKYVTPGSRILDLGCGSGILSIVSLLLGGKFAFAVDIDENAVDVAYENAALNGIGKDKYYVTSGDVLSDSDLIEEIGENSFDIAAANIVADVIIGIAPAAYRAVKPGGVFISSGIIKDRLSEVVSALEESGFVITDTSVKDEWCALTAEKG
ncbi:MAG: 50S ribosomal protein L11 methyltransferase [Clostridiales bacterium]|nr:50S ribosomal protein L11 methyltransferase [Clostridiales bacterium]